jgi:hypothetical protein
VTTARFVKPEFREQTGEMEMKRTTSLVGSAVAAMIAAAAATPAFAQATTYPAGTDCSAISNSASRMECTSQQKESRRAPDTGNVAPSPNGTGTAQPGAPSSTPNAAPSPSGTANPTTGTPSGAGTTTGGGATTTP